MPDNKFTLAWNLFAELRKELIELEKVLRETAKLSCKDLIPMIPSKNQDDHTNRDPNYQ